VARILSECDADLSDLIIQGGLNMGVALFIVLEVLFFLTIS
jgi:hypothetical protein